MSKLEQFKFMIQTRWQTANDFQKYGILLASVSLFGFLISSQNPSEASRPAIEPPSVDTFIPAGYVLVPIEIENQASLDGLIGDRAVVNLFPSGVEGHTKFRRPIVEHVKLLRAPLNPSQFAVLVPDQIAPNLVRLPGPFFVMIENPGQKQRPPSPKRPSTQQKVRIEYATMD